jgi:hypothetical protein
VPKADNPRRPVMTMPRRIWIFAYRLDHETLGHAVYQKILQADPDSMLIIGCLAEDVLASGVLSPPVRGDMGDKLCRRVFRRGTDAYCADHGSI